MRTALIFLAGLALASPTATAQNFIDPFNYPAGTIIPGYTEQVGDWTCTGTAVRSQSLSSYQALTLDAITDRDAAVEVLAVYNTAAPGLQFVGPIIRYSGSGSSLAYFMLKLQDNSSPYTGFDRLFVYYNSSNFGITYIDIVPPTTMARARIQTVEEAAGVRVSIFVDSDLDGRWNYTAETVTTVGAGLPGKIGICGYNGALADDLKYFSGTLVRTAAPAIGTSMPLVGRGSPNLLYLAACSLGHSGFPVPGGGVVPLDIDPMFDLSLNTPSIFQNFSGLTALDGTFNMLLNIPYLPAIVGATLWTAAVTSDGTSIIEITPDVQLTLQ